mgnify:CR=1 FL=1
MTNGLILALAAVNATFYVLCLYGVLYAIADDETPLEAERRRQLRKYDGGKDE